MGYVRQYQVDSLHRVQDFVGIVAAEVGSLETSGAAQQLDTSIEQLNAQILQKATAALTARGLITREAALSAELRDKHMNPLATFAQAGLKGSPAIAALTGNGAKLKGTALVGAARAMATAAASHLDDLVAMGLPADVVEQLAAAAEALDDVISQRVSLKQTRVGATNGIKQQLANGRDAVNMLDGIIRRHFAGNATKLASWRYAKRIMKKPGVVSTSAASKEAAQLSAESAAQNTTA